MAAAAAPQEGCGRGMIYGAQGEDDVQRLAALPRIGPDEIRRLVEDKSADLSAMRSMLGGVPVGLEAGLSSVPGLTLGRLIERKA